MYKPQVLRGVVYELVYDVIQNSNILGRSWSVMGEHFPAPSPPTDNSDRNSGCNDSTAVYIN